MAQGVREERGALHVLLKQAKKGFPEEVGRCRMPEDMDTTHKQEGGKPRGVGKHKPNNGNKGTAGPPWDRNRPQTELLAV